MTLITYLTRVHFADSVLEEALWSEVKAFDKERPLVLIDQDNLDNETTERFLSGLPVKTKTHIFTDIPIVPTQKAVEDVAKAYLKNKCDIIVAFGGANAIDLAKIARIAIKHPNTDLINFSHARGGSKRIGADLPDLIAAPNILGVSASVSAHAAVVLESGERVLTMCKKLIPTVTICDPTITISANKEQTASAGADAITRCIEAYLSKSYNPPAEGIALDGLHRAVGNLYDVVKDGNNEEGRRELMAASLNGALALQKGLGASHAISSALQAVTSTYLDHGTLSRITLPSVLRYNEDYISGKYSVLHAFFEEKVNDNFPETVENYFRKLPIKSTLRELELTANDLRSAALIASKELASVTNPRNLDTDQYYAIMRSVY